MSTSAHLRALRINAGLSQQEIADEVSAGDLRLNRTLLSHIENGNVEVSPEMADAIRSAVLSIMNIRRVTVGELIASAEPVAATA